MVQKREGPDPRMPAVARITDVKQILPMAREMVKKRVAHLYDSVEIKKGDRVLIINDSTADQLVVEALSIAIRERGAHLTTINLEGFIGLKDSIDILDNMFSTNWYPSWAWDAANDVDIVLLTAFSKAPYIPTPSLSHNPKIQNMEITADLMVDEYETYPVELRDTIDKVAWEKLENCSEIRWTDLEGTNIRMNLTADEWRKSISDGIRRGGKPYRRPGHMMLPAPSQGINGVLVTSSITFGGPVPRTSLEVEKGKVVKVEGGGKFGERLRESFEKYGNLTNSDVSSLKCPGQGVNWLTTIAICTNPKARRSPFFDELSGSARVYAWTFGHRRSGVIHSSIGEGLVSPTYRIIRHVDVYFSTITTDKGTVIENGHLTALDDPRVREVASKYGDPDHLLNESWIPAVQGVNKGV